MIEFPFQPAMAPGLAMLSRPEKLPAIAPVKSSNASGGANLQGNQTPAKTPPSELQRHLARNRPNERLVGPPPSFRANVLEVESDIKLAIQQLEVKREQFRNGDAVAAKSDAENPAENDESREPVISEAERGSSERDIARDDLA